MLPWLRPFEPTQQNQKVRAKMFVHNYALYKENKAAFYIQPLRNV